MINSLERIIPKLTSQNASDQQTLQLHLERYIFAGEHLLPGIIADIACGTGYGSFLLATQYNNKVEKIYAVDHDTFSIDYAEKNYPHPSISYLRNDATTFEPQELLSSIVSLETIEHLENPGVFIRMISRHLVSKGRFIVSAPITPSMDANPYHLQDFSTRSLTKLFSDAGFTLVASFTQKQVYNPLLILARKGERLKDTRQNLLAFYWNHPDKFIARIKSVLLDGFSNKYFVGVFEKG